MGIPGLGTGRGLRLRVLSIPVHVDVTFVVLALFLGAPLVREAPGLLPAWLGVVFVSVLAHELGHALAFRAAGSHPTIALHLVGGSTTPGPGSQDRPARELVAVSAGPLAGFTLAGVCWLAGHLLQPGWEWLAFALRTGTVANLVWSGLNLLPILPLDGGRLLQGGLRLARLPGAERATAAVSVVVAGAGAAFALYAQQLWTAVVAGFLVYLNWTSWRTGAQRPHDGTCREFVDASSAYRLGRAEAVPRLLGLLDRPGAAEHVRLGAGVLLLHHSLSRGDRATAQGVLERLPAASPLRRGVEPVVERGLVSSAVEAARAVFGAHPVPLAGELVIRDLAAAGWLDEVVAFEIQQRTTLGAHGAHVAVEVLFHAGRYDDAILVGRAAWDTHGDALFAYNLACWEARRGDVGAAVGWLDRAVAAGFANADQLDADEDLASVRRHPGYAVVRARVRP